MSKSTEIKDITEEVTDMEVESIEGDAPDKAPEESPIKCEVIIGIREDNTMIFAAHGNDPNLVHISGLLEYAQLRVQQLWIPPQPAKQGEAK